MKKSILQCRALQKHLFLDKHKANAPKRNFGFILFIQYSVASHKLAPLFFIFKSNGKLLAKANRQVIL
ncbi:hypothetical protein ACQ1RA_05035, partial [Ornithobacterium rhinotracheale]